MRRRRFLGTVALAVSVLVLVLGGCAGATARVEPSPSPSPSAYAAAGFAHVWYAGQSLTELGFAAMPPPDPDVVAGSQFIWTVREFAVTDEIGLEQREELRMPPWPRPEPDGPLLASPGREFLVGWVEVPPEAPPPDSSIPLDLVVQVEGEEPVQLDSVPPIGPGVIVVSVPVGRDAVVEVADDRGQSWSFSLRTGRLLAGESRPADTLAKESVAVSDYFTISGVTLAEVLEGVRCRVQIVPTTYVHDEGQAAPGHMWLQVRVRVSFDISLDWQVYHHAEIEVDLDESLTIVADNGDRLSTTSAVVRPSATPGSTLSGASDEWSGRFEVPDTVRSFDVSFRMQATFTDRETGQVLPYQRTDHSDNTDTLTLGEVE